MTKHSHTLAIPQDLQRLESKPEFILWLASYNLPPDDAYRTYKDWCEATGHPVSRLDLNDLCGLDFNVN